MPRGLLLCISALLCATSAVSNATDTDQAALNKTVLSAAKPIHHSAEGFTGVGWQELVDAARSADFLLVGEEHGIAENPLLVSQLFTQAAFSILAIETSPAMANQLDAAARDGLEGIRALFSQPGALAAFFTMREEAMMLATLRQQGKRQSSMFWGLDYEVLGNRYLLSQLNASQATESAKQALDAVLEDAEQSWQQFEQTQSPQYFYAFNGDPELVYALRQQWPTHQVSAHHMLANLEQTLRINQQWVAGNGWHSNALRAQLLKDNFMRLWRQHSATESNRILFKFGASHMMRGRNMSDVYDLGTLLPEIAYSEGKQVLQVLVLPGDSAQTAVFNPVELTFAPSAPKDGYSKGLEPLYQALQPNQPALIDLRELRGLPRAQRKLMSSKMENMIHGFDYAIILQGSTPSTDLMLEAAN